MLTSLPRGVRRAALALAALTLMVAADRLAGRLATRFVLAEMEAGARAAAELRATVLRAEIEKQRSLPVILAQDPDLIRALDRPEPGRLAALNVKLERLAEGTRTAVIYALDREGRTVAASNWRSDTSFVGQDYAFRPYFQEALGSGAAEHFALGTVSQRPGLYLTRRLEDAGGPLGVIVVKAEFAEVEEAWRRLREPVLTTDDRGIVTVTSVPEWHFLATRPLEPAAREAIRGSLQFGETPLRDLAFTPHQASDGHGLLRLDEPAARGLFLPVSTPVPGTGWSLTLLAPTAPTLEAARAAARAWALLLGLALMALLGLTLRRRRRMARERRREAERRRALEAEVGQRTAELSAANASLRAEAEERQRAEAALHRMRDELGQANRLAILGQITASVAHEINQPVAAIRSFADNAAEFVARGEAAMAGRGLATIAALTERIGTITAGLRGFARKATGEVEPMPIRTAIEGALLLLGHRLRHEGIAVSLAIEGEPCVRAERVRLEQVLVNLIQNAIEALHGAAAPRIAISAAATGGRVRVRVADNGPGLPPEVRRSLFMPFTTTKSAGLGLGLVISRGILADLGGTLEAPETPGGASFVITLDEAGPGMSEGMSRETGQRGSG